MRWHLSKQKSKLLQADRALKSIAFLLRNQVHKNATNKIYLISAQSFKLNLKDVKSLKTGMIRSAQPNLISQIE